MIAYRAGSATARGDRCREQSACTAPMPSRAGMSAPNLGSAARPARRPGSAYGPALLALGSATTVREVEAHTQLGTARGSLHDRKPSVSCEISNRPRPSPSLSQPA